MKKILFFGILLLPNHLVKQFKYIGLNDKYKIVIVVCDVRIPTIVWLLEVLYWNIKILIL